MSRQETIDKVVLYHYPLTRSVRVLWALHELEIPVTVERVDLMHGGALTEEFVKKNPNHAVPVLEFQKDGNQVTMIESAAMVAFLADLPSQKTRLAPGLENLDALARADYLQMLMHASSWQDMILWNIRMHCDLLPPDLRDQNTVIFYKNKWRTEIEPQMVARLRKHDYMTGKEFSAVDIIVGHNIVWSRSYGLSDRPEIKVYLRRLTSRPAFRKAFSDAKEFKDLESDSAITKNLGDQTESQL